MKIILSLLIKFKIIFILILNKTNAFYNTQNEYVNYYSPIDKSENHFNKFKRTSSLNFNFTQTSYENRSLLLESNNSNTTKIDNNSDRILVKSCQWPEVNDEDTDECQGCKEFEKYYQKGKCVEKCDSNSRIIKELNICYKCENLLHFYHRGECVEECPPNTVKKKEEGLCYECKWVDKYFHEDRCVERCPPTTMIDEEERICINCKDMGKYVHNMICVDECPPGTSLYDFYTNFCIDCYFIEKYNSTGFCYDSCGMDFGRDLEKCKTCSEDKNSPILNNGKCDTKCNPIDVYNPETKKCEGCKSQMPSKFLLNLNNDPQCVLNCGNYSTNYDMNYCITDEKEYCRMMSNSCSNKGICKFINSNNHICLCDEKVYGVNCEIQDLNVMSNCVSVINQMLEIISKVKEINFSLLNNEIYHSLFDDYVKCSQEIPQYLFTNSLSMNKIQDFILTYYSSDEVKSLLYNDFEEFILNFDILFNLDYYDLWNDHTIKKLNGTQLLTKRKNYLDRFQTFILKFFMLTPYFLKDAQFDYIDIIFGKYGKYWGKQLYVDIFHSQLYNQNVYYKQNKLNYNTYFRFKDGCNSLPVNSTLITINLESDMSFFSDTIEYLSNHFYIGVIDSNFKMTSVECPPTIYFEMKDNPNFNYSLSNKKWREIAELGINPFDPNDSYFSEICYKYPLNMSLTNYTRGLRLSNYFMNYTLKCMAKTIDSDVTKECKFVGFENSFEEYGPNPYVKCECGSIDSNSYYYIEIKRVDEVPLQMPFFQVWACVRYGFNFLTSFYNPGFFAVLLLLVFQGVGLILHFITLEIQFLDYFEWIRRHDMENFGLLTEDEQKKSNLGKIKESAAKISVQQNDDKKSGMLNKAFNFFSRKNRRNETILKPKSNQNETAIKVILTLTSRVHMSDYIYLPYTTFLHIDDRDSLIYFCDFWHDYHIFSVTFIKFGYFMPRSIRIVNFYLYLLSHFFGVALILSPEEENIDIFGYDYRQLNGGIILYAFLSAVYANVVYYLMALFLKIPREVKLYLNKALMKKYYTIREFQ